MKIITTIIIIISSIIVCLSNSYGEESQLSPLQQLQFKNLSSNLRCVVCNNESIYESDTPIANNIRNLIKERLGQGQNPSLIKNYLHKRYGDVILLTPPFNKNTFAFWLIIWIILLLLISIVVVIIYMSMKKANTKTITHKQSLNNHEKQIKALSTKKAYIILTSIIAGALMVFIILFVKLEGYNSYKSINSFKVNIDTIQNKKHLTLNFCENPSMELTAILMGEKDKIATLVRKCSHDYPNSTYIKNLKTTLN